MEYKEGHYRPSSDNTKSLAKPGMLHTQLITILILDSKCPFFIDELNVWNKYVPWWQYWDQSRLIFDLFFLDMTIQQSISFRLLVLSITSHFTFIAMKSDFLRGSRFWPFFYYQKKYQKSIKFPILPIIMLNNFEVFC